LLQPGNSVQAIWRARFDEQLGYYLIEERDARGYAARVVACGALTPRHR
jgi:hypothetical protein